MAKFCDGGDEPSWFLINAKGFSQLNEFHILQEDHGINFDIFKPTEICESSLRDLRFSRR
jgi:hypothetical protein